MNSFNKYLFACALIGTLFIVGCADDFLDVKPKGKVIASRAVDYNNLLEEVAFTYIAYMEAQHIMGDDVAGLTPHYSSTQYFGATGTRRPNMFEWKDNIYLENEEDVEITTLYNRIYVANKIINEVLDAIEGSEQQKKQYYAEALAQRAFTYFLLINYYGKPYSSETADSDPGVPLVLKGDFTRTDYSRASVQTIYDQIVEDLKEAIKYLPLQQNNANRFTLAAGEALLGKVYLFKQDWNNAAIHLNLSIQNIPGTFTSGSKIELINYNTTPMSPAPLGYAFTVPTSTAAQGNGYPETLTAIVVPAVYWLGYAASLVISPDTYALFGPNDVRKKLYVNTYSPVAPSTPMTLPNGLYRSKNGFIGNSLGIQLPDIYLLDAEAKARTGDLTGATASLLTLRQNRMPDSDAVAAIPNNQNDLIRFIIEERRREFATQGFRWFDMRRLSNDPLFPKTTYTHTLYDGSNGQIIETYTLDTKRFQLRFSENLVKQSPGLVNNP